MVFPDLQGRLVGKRTTGRFFLEQRRRRRHRELRLPDRLRHGQQPGARLPVHQLRAGLRRHAGPRRLGHGAHHAVGRQDGDDHVRPVRRRHRRTDRGGAAHHPAPPGRSGRRAWATCRWWPARSSSTCSRTPTTRPTPRATATCSRTRRGSRTTTSCRRPRTSTSSAQIRRGLEAAGVPVEFSKGEAGKGQHEINLDYTTAVEMADRNSVYKTAAKEIAHLNGRSVSFMAKYDFNDTGSSCHIHSQPVDRWTARRRCSTTTTAPHGMSELFQHYLAGLIATAREFSLLWAPTVNSYKRFQLGLVGADRRSAGASTTARSASARSATARAPGSSAASPAATPTATSPSPARWPAGCTASATSCRSASRSSATATRRPTSTASRGTCPTRSRCGRAQHDRPRVLRRRRAPPHPHDGQGRVAGVQPDRHRLGAAPLLGAHLTCGVVRRHLACARTPPQQRRAAS